MAYGSLLLPVVGSALCVIGYSRPMPAMPDRPSVLNPCRRMRVRTRGQLPREVRCFEESRESGKRGYVSLQAWLSCFFASAQTDENLRLYKLTL